jgi:hypothetical protein
MFIFYIFPFRTLRTQRVSRVMLESHGYSAETLKVMHLGISTESYLLTFQVVNPLPYGI